MGDTTYTKYLQIEKKPPYQWFEGDKFGNILSFHWLEEQLIVIIQTSNGVLVELIITDI